MAQNKMGRSEKEPNEALKKYKTMTIELEN